MNSIDEMILKYLDNEMSPSEKTDFLRSLESNKSLREKVELMKKAKESFLVYREVEKKFEYPLQFRPVKKSNAIFSIKPGLIYSSAGVLAIVLILIFMIPVFHTTINYDPAKIVTEMKQSEISAVLRNLDNELYSSEKTKEGITDSTLNSYLIQEISNNKQDVTGYLSGSDSYTNYSGKVLNSISTDEAEQIFNELINKKIL